MYRYTVVLTPEPVAGGYSVHVPALPGCFSQGETLDEAVYESRQGWTFGCGTRRRRVCEDVR